MNVIAFVSRNAGAGKSTLAAQLAAAARAAGHSCILVAADPQNTQTLLAAQKRRHNALAVVDDESGIDQLLAGARRSGISWVFIDTSSEQPSIVDEAIRAATLVVIPARATRFDLGAVGEAVITIRERNKPYAVVINAAPAMCDGNERPAVAAARAQLKELSIPVWKEQITQRAGLAISLVAGGDVFERSPQSPAAQEIAALWSALARSVTAINRARSRKHPVRARAA